MRMFVPALLASIVLAQQEVPQAVPQQPRQPADPFSFVPRHADVVVRALGPKALAERFGKTRIGRVLQSEQLDDIWRRVGEQLLAELSFDDETNARLDRLWSGIAGLDGDAVAALRVDWDRLEPESQRFEGAAVVAIRGDGADDLEALATGLRELLPGIDHGELELLGQHVPMRRVDSCEIAGPFVHDGCLLAFVGTDLADRSRWFLTDTADADELADVRAAPLALTWRAQPTLDFLAKFADELPQAPFPPGDLLEAIGARAIERLSATAFVDGDLLGQRIRLDFSGDRRGLFDVLAPARSRRPDLLRFLPADAGTYRAGQLAGGELERLYRDVFADLGGRFGSSREDIERRFTQLTRLDLVEDVLAQIGDEYMVIEDLAAAIEFDEDVPEAVDEARDRIGNTCYVVRVRDGRKLAKDLETVLRARGLHVSRKRQDYAGTTIHRLNLMGMFPVEFATTASLLVVGVGESETTRKDLRAVLDHAANLQGGEAPPFSEAVQARLARMPAGWSGIEVASTIDALDGLIATFDGLKLAFDGIDQTDTGFFLLGEAAAVLKPLMLRHEIDHNLSLDYVSKDRYVLETRW